MGFIKIDNTDMAKVQAMLSSIGNETNKVLARAINGTMKNVQTDAVKRLGKILNLKASRIKKDFTQNKATSKKTWGHLLTSSKRVGIASFKGTKQTLKGAIVKTHKTKPKSLYKHAFLAQGRNIKTNDQMKTAAYFWRKKKDSWDRNPNWANRNRFYSRLPYSYRFKISMVKGPRIWDEYKRPAFMKKTLDFADERMSANMDMQLSQVLKKL